MAEHWNDFDEGSFAAFMKKQGGYRAYLQTLGGVFEKYADFTGKITKASEFKELAEYVIGLMQIYGFCYEGGGEGNRYGGRYPFYSSGKGGRDWGETYTIDEKCSGAKGTNCMSTDCGMGLEMLAKKAGLYKGRAYNLSELKKSPDFKLITNAGDLMVGDLIQCYTGFKMADKRELPHPVYGYSGHRWDTDKGWFHVTVVGEIDREAGTMTLYDTGHYFTDSGEYINVRPLKGEIPYQWADEWCAYRVNYLEQDGKAKDSEEMIAGQVLRGLWGSGEARKARLNACGYDYTKIQKLVDDLLKADDIETAKNKALAREVWDGRWGSGTDRRRRLTSCGYDYEAVQKEVDKLGE